MSKKRIRLPPKDSWIELSAGESLRIDAEFQAKWRNQAARFRELRGSFLAGCFEIEYQLDLALCEVLFPGLDDPKAKPADNVPLTVESGKVLKELFDDLILKSVILTASIVERQQDRETREWKYVVQGQTLDGRGGFVVTKFGLVGRLYILTVYAE